MDLSYEMKLTDRTKTTLAFILVALFGVLCLHYVISKTVLGEHMGGILLASRDVMVFGLFVVAALGTGSWILRLILGEADGELIWTVCAVALGLSVFSVLGILYALLHVVYVPLLWVTVLIPLLLFRNELGRHLQVARQTWAGLSGQGLLGMAVLLLWGLYLLAALSPPSDYDPLTYHLVIPKEALNYHGFPAVTHTTFNYFPPAASMLYLFLMGMGSDFLPKVLHFFLFLLMALTVIGYAKGRDGWRPAVWAALFLSCQWIIQHGVTRANVDFHVGFYSTISFFVLLEAMDRLDEARNPLPMLLISAALLGTAMSGKYTAISSLIGTNAVLLYLMFRRRLSFGRVFTYNAISLMVFLPVLVRNYLYTDDPLFWNLTGYLQSERIVTTEELSMLSDLIPLVYPRASLSLYLLGPLYTYIYGRYPSPIFDGFIDPFFLLTLPMAFFFRKQLPRLGLMGIYLVVYYLVWMKTAAVTRYLMPILPMLCLLSIRVVNVMADVSGERWRRAIAVGLLGSIAFFSLWNMADFYVVNKHYWSNSVPLFLRLVDRQEYLKYTFAGPTLEAERVINAYEEGLSSEISEAPTGKIFMILASQSYYLSRPVYSDTLHSNLALLQSIEMKGEDPIEWLVRNGYRYIIFDIDRVRWYASSAEAPSSFRPEEKYLERLRDRVLFFNERIRPYLTEIGRAGKMIVFTPNTEAKGDR